MKGKAQFCNVGDSAYSISEHMMKPFSEREISKEEDATVQKRKVLFNRKLCGACIVMSEIIYSTMKRRWPILKNMTHHLNRVLTAKKY